MSPGTAELWTIEKSTTESNFTSTATWDPPLNESPTILIDGLEEAESFSSLSADHSGDVWVFWHNEITSGFNIEFRRRTTSGWQNLTVLTTGSGDAVTPVSAVDADNNVHVLWSDNRNSGNWDVYYKKMDAIPYPPATLTYENLNGHPKLIWSKGKSKDTAGYKVYRGGNVIATKNSASDTTHVDPDVFLTQQGLNITYTVRSFDSHVPSQLSNPSPTLTVTGVYGKVMADGALDVHSVITARNYPNPFNPSTEIIYAIPGDGQVSLNVFDALGRNVASLVNEFKTAGKYSVGFGGAHLSSGMYFYRMHHNGTTVSGKIILAR